MTKSRLSPSRNTAPIDASERLDDTDLTGVLFGFTNFIMNDRVHSYNAGYDAGFVAGRAPAVAADREAIASAHAALFEPEESDAIDNLEGALIDIKRLSAAGKPTDAVCIRTLERIQEQLVKAHAALATRSQP